MLGVTESGPPAGLTDAGQLDPFLRRYKMTKREMAILTIGAHAVRNSVINPFPYDGQNSGPKFINDTLSYDWKFDAEAKSPTSMTLQKISNMRADVYLVNPVKDSGKRLARLESDMLFFPKKLRNLNQDYIHDMSFSPLEDDLSQLTEEQFDFEFELAYEKMLAVGHHVPARRIRNRPKAAHCPADPYM